MDPFDRNSIFPISACQSESPFAGKRTNRSFGSLTIVTLACGTCFLHTNAGHISKRAENAAFSCGRQHLSPTRGAGMANPSQTSRNVALFRAAAEGTGQLGFRDHNHDDTVPSQVGEFHSCLHSHLRRAC